MNIYKVAILIDGAFFRFRYKALNGKNPRANDVQSYVKDITKRINSITAQDDPNSGNVLWRIFYYDCRAYSGKQRKPDGTEIDFSQLPAFQASSLFIKDLKTMPQLALRLGDMSFDGWKINPSNPACPVPDFKQKSVDMKIGLDIAWMATKRTVDKIVLVAGDSDFVSPMKYARKEGLLVYLDPMGQKQIKIILMEHADFII